LDNKKQNQPILMTTEAIVTEARKSLPDPSKIEQSFYMVSVVNPMAYQYQEGMEDMIDPYYIVKFEKRIREGVEGWFFIEIVNS
jgi:hypothetical protein